MPLYVVHYQGSTTRVTATNPLAAVRKAHRARKGSTWTETLSPHGIRHSAVVLLHGKIVGRAELQKRA